ncbi:MAG: LysR family transcriptional regulator [Myxococcota bacterium]
MAALERTGTVTEAAARLRLTQSAVSKRLAALSAAVGADVVAPEGRRLRVTAEGLALLERARPLIAGLQALTVPGEAASTSTFSLALSESIAASWGLFALAAALARVPAVRVEVHATAACCCSGPCASAATTPGSPPISPPRPICCTSRWRGTDGLRARGAAARTGGGPLLHDRGHVGDLAGGGAAAASAAPRRCSRGRWCRWSRSRRRCSSCARASATGWCRSGWCRRRIRRAAGTGGCWRGVARPISLVARKTVHHRRGFAALRDALREEAAAWCS